MTNDGIDLVPYNVKTHTRGWLSNSEQMFLPDFYVVMAVVHRGAMESQYAGRQGGVALTYTRSLGVPSGEKSSDDDITFATAFTPNKGVAIALKQGHSDHVFCSCERPMENVHIIKGNQIQDEQMAFEHPTHSEHDVAYNLTLQYHAGTVAVFFGEDHCCEFAEPVVDGRQKQTKFVPGGYFSLWGPNLDDPLPTRLAGFKLQHIARRRHGEKQLPERPPKKGGDRREEEASGTASSASRGEESSNQERRGHARSKSVRSSASGEYHDNGVASRGEQSTTGVATRASGEGTEAGEASQSDIAGPRHHPEVASDSRSDVHSNDRSESRSDVEGGGGGRHHIARPTHDNSPSRSDISQARSDASPQQGQDSASKEGEASGAAPSSAKIERQEGGARSQGEESQPVLRDSTGRAPLQLDDEQQQQQQEQEPSFEQSNSNNNNNQDGDGTASSSSNSEPKSADNDGVSGFSQDNGNSTSSSSTSKQESQEQKDDSTVAKVDVVLDDANLSEQQQKEKSQEEEQQQLAEEEEDADEAAQKAADGNNNNNVLSGDSLIGEQ